MPFITSNDGKKVWYDVIGNGEPLVLIGGSSAVHRQWDFVLPILKDYFKVILYDQRGAGLSDRSPAGITVEQWVDDLKMVLDEIGLKKTHIFGTSNGSFVVIRFAAKYPERTAGIIHYGLYKTSDETKKMWRNAMKIVDEFGIGKGEKGAISLVRLFGAPLSHEEWIAKRFEENLTPDSWKAMHMGMEVDLSKDLPKIKAPQLILTGDKGLVGRDSDYGSGWRDVQRLCSNVEVAVIHGGEGPWCTITHPAEVAKEVFGFLKKHRIGA